MRPRGPCRSCRPHGECGDVPRASAGRISASPFGALASDCRHEGHGDAGRSRDASTSSAICVRYIRVGRRWIPSRTWRVPCSRPAWSVAGRLTTLMPTVGLSVVRSTCATLDIDTALTVLTVAADRQSGRFRLPSTRWHRASTWGPSRTAFVSKSDRSYRVSRRHEWAKHTPDEA